MTDVAYIYPTSVVYDPFSAGAGVWANVDGPFDAPDSTRAFIGDNVSSGRSLTFGMGLPPRFISISKVTIGVRLQVTNTPAPQPDGDIGFGPRISGTSYYDHATVTTTIALFQKAMTTNPATAATWTQADIDAMQVDFWDYAPDATREAAYLVYAKIEGVLAPTQQEASRTILSSRLRLMRRPRLLVLDLPLLRADTDILSDISIAHRDYAWASSGQRGVNPWERPYLRVLKQAPDFLEMRTRVTAIDLRRYITSLWDTLRSDEDPSAQYHGVARLNAGAGRSFSRGSYAWIPSPVAQAKGLVRVIRISESTEATLYDGTLIEEAATNQLKRSSAVSGATGYSDSGASGSWTTTTSTDPLFDSSVTANVIVGTAGSPHTADLIRTFPDTASLSGGTYVAVQVDHKDDSGAALGWRLQRLVDNWYWNASGAAWQSGSVTNLMTVRTEWQTDPDRLGVFSIGASASALRFSLVIPSGGTSGRVNRIAHAQIGDQRWYASRIVTDSATVTKSADDVTYENNTGKRSHTAAQGSMRVDVIPSFNSADLASGTLMVVWEAYHDANNWEYFAFSKDDAGWIYRRKAAGATTTAIKTATATAGTRVRLGARWTGTAGEWGLAAYTLSAFADGVKGTDATAAAAITEVSTATLRIGRNNSGNRFCGRISEIDFSPFVWSDDEFVDA